MRRYFLLVLIAASLTCAIPRDATAAMENQLSVGLGMRTWVHAQAGLGRYAISGSSVMPPDSLWFDIPVMYRFSAGGFFAFGIGGMATIIKTADKMGGGAHLVGTIRGNVVPGLIYIDFDLVLGFPILFGWTPALGISVPVSPEINLVVENQFPMAWLGSFLVFWEPSIGVEFAF